MATLDEVYRKFGEVHEAAQLLETELGNVLMMHKCIDADLLNRPNPKLATDFYDQINKMTLGKMKDCLVKREDAIKEIEQVLKKAVDSRNQLSHFFYVKHNFRRFSNDGREIMLRDLEAIHEVLQEAYMAVRPITVGFIRKLGTDPSEIPIPSGHVQF